MSFKRKAGDQGRSQDDGQDGEEDMVKKKKFSLRKSSDRIIVEEGASLKPTNSLVGPLLTDLYQLTMAYAYWKSGKQNDQAVFDLFFRSNPFRGEFTVFAGLEEVLRYVHSFSFSDEDIAFLKETMPHCEDSFFQYLRGVDCSQIKIFAIPEGSIVFPRVPLLRVEGPLIVAQLLETTLLCLVNYPSLMVTNAARHRLAATPDVSLVEFGLRRAQGVDGGVSASRYSYMGGFDGTSNVLAAKLFGIPPKGTHAHSFVSSFISDKDLMIRELKDTSGKVVNFYDMVLQARKDLQFGNTSDGELCAFVAYAISFPTSFLALVDTYDTLKSGVPNFLCVALALHRAGYKAIGIRLDSGDLAYLSKEARSIFKRVGEKCQISYFATFSIAATNDLHEATILSLNQQGHEINLFGIGTHLVTCNAQPALGCVYKLVEINGEPRIKVSQDISKVTLPGRKEVYRLYGNKEYPVIDVLVKPDGEIPYVGKKILCLHPFEKQKRAYITPTKVVPLHHLYWDCGKITRDLPSLEELRTSVINQVKIMRTDHLRLLNPTPYKVSVTTELFNLVHDLWQKEVPIQEITE